MPTIRKSIIASLAAIAGAIALANHREPRRGDKREAVSLGIPSSMRRYAKRYASLPSGTASKFRGFRKVRRSWLEGMPDGSLGQMSAWVRK